MTRHRRIRNVIGSAIGLTGIAIIALTGTAYACTTFVGKVTVKGNSTTATSTSIGYNEFNSTDGMYYCSSTNTKVRTTSGGAEATFSGPQATITVVPAGSGVCTGGTHDRATNGFPGAIYDVNWVNRIGSAAPFSCSGSTCTLNPAVDCMSPRLTGVSFVGKITIDSSGYSLNSAGTARGSRTYNLPSAPVGDSLTVQSAVCVSDTSTTYANQIPIRML